MEEVPEDFWRRFGARVRAMRERRMLTQEELAGRAKLTGGAFVSDVERGVRPIGFGVIVQIIELGLGSTMADAFDGLRVHPTNQVREKATRYGARGREQKSEAIHQLAERLSGVADLAKRDLAVEILQAVEKLAKLD